MAKTQVSKLAVGSTIKARISGVYYDFRVINQGVPTSGSYDSSCDGTWLTPEECLTTSIFDDATQFFKNASIKDYLDNVLYSTFDNGLRGVIKTVKLPYSNSSSSVQTGTNGMEAKLFLLSAAELGLTGGSNYNQEGAKLSYFSDNTSRIAKYNGEAKAYFTRSLDSTNASNIICINTDGSAVSVGISTEQYIRPAFVIYNTCYVDENNILVPDFAPVITSAFAENGANIGRKNASFAFTYTVTTSRPDLTLEVEEILSGKDVNKTKKKITSVTSGQQRTFSVVVDNADDFYNLMNGEKTLTVRAYYSDYNNTAVNSESEYYITFEKYVNTVTITLKSPLTVSGNITKGAILVKGDIPDDATYKVEATNNNSTWQDVTYYVRNNSEFTFTNVSETNTSFNFRITATRGGSDLSGYFTAVVGAFE